MVNKNRLLFIVLVLFSLFTFAAGAPTTEAEAASEKRAAPKQLIFDEAGLLSRADYDELSAMAYDYGSQRDTDMIIFTTPNPAGIDVVKLTQDFYDKQAPGFDKPHGNAVLLTLDMKHREVYLAGFYKAKEYLDDGRLDRIRNRITPELTSGDYALAFQTYIELSHRYLGYPPGVDPDNILFKTWFQLAVSIGIAGAVVGVMAYRSGGRVTVDRRTYEDAAHSGILERQDQYLHTVTTKRKIETNSGRRGGGGGTTGGGHSHSGSRGSF